jgi:glycosyltransferase involved in cell wall biosynthesis
VSVAQGCCRQASTAGHDVTLLLALPPTGYAAEFGNVHVDSLAAEPPYADIPLRLLAWLDRHPQDVLLLNGCEQADVAIPYFPNSARVVYVVHDTADRYFEAAVRFEDDLDAIIAVSNTVADRFRSRLKLPRKLHVIPNGTIFPIPEEEAISAIRGDDLVFIGGDDPMKGSHDVLALWRRLQKLEFVGRLHWFGSVSEAMRAKIAVLPCSDRIELHGRQPRKKIFDTAARSKILLMLSRGEPFGMVTVECMGVGCTPVAWDISTGTKEIIEDSEGLFVVLGDHQRLAQAVMGGLKMHAVRFPSSMSRIGAKFNEHAMWSRYDEVLEIVLKAQPSRREMAGKLPPRYSPPLRLSQFMPQRLKIAIRATIGRYPRIGYALRDFRGR